MCTFIKYHRMTVHHTCFRTLFQYLSWQPHPVYIQPENVHLAGCSGVLVLPPLHIYFAFLLSSYLGILFQQRLETPMGATPNCPLASLDEILCLWSEPNLLFPLNSCWSYVSWACVPSSKIITKSNSSTLKTKRQLFFCQLWRWSILGSESHWSTKQFSKIMTCVFLNCFTDQSFTEPVFEVKP